MIRLASQPQIPPTISQIMKFMSVPSCYSGPPLARAAGPAS
jgi:hypothetical protein